jgi:hypothetical protein
MSNSSLPWAVSTSAENKWELAAITSSAWVPMEPVEPNKAIRFLFVSAMGNDWFFSFKYFG